MQCDHASVTVAEDPRNRATRPEAGESIRPFKTETAAGLRQAGTMPRFSAPSGLLPAARRAADSTITCRISPTQFHEEPSFFSRRLARAPLLRMFQLRQIAIWVLGTSLGGLAFDDDVKRLLLVLVLPLVHGP